MNNDAIVECVKLKRKECRMKIDKLKDVARPQNHDRVGKLKNKKLMEKYRYDVHESSSW